MDNGFLLLNNVKVPHVNMLARFSSVDARTSKYVKPPSASLVYGKQAASFLLDKLFANRLRNLDLG